MIPVNQHAWESERWQSELQQAIRSSADLLSYLGTQIDDICHDPNFPVLVPVSFAQRMQPGDPKDPLLRQVLATTPEHQLLDGFSTDPLQEQGLADDNALLQKYAHRALLITTSGCAVNCRYCFRRHFPYKTHRDHHLQHSLAQIRRDKSLQEIILSGGDPLLLADAQLLAVLKELDRLAHVKRLRIHTRLPVVIPNRVTDTLIAGLDELNTPLVIVIHTNHAQELNDHTARALATLGGHCTQLLNQSVLLHGVNDNPSALVDLSNALFDQGVLPYYLHTPDHVQGTQHFFVDDQQAVRLHSQMQAQLPGYLVPKLVREIPDQPNKVILA